MGKRILVFTEVTFEGSGYTYLMLPMLQKLGESGYDVKAVGLGYKGEEHDSPYSLVPCSQLAEGVVSVQNIIQLWKPDLLIVGFDIPVQIGIYKEVSKFKVPYLAITPMENPPLTQTWAAHLMMLDRVLFISELAKEAALKAGLTKVDHMVVGVDSELFRRPTVEERTAFRKVLGIADDEFAILTVADNQERKNLWAGLVAVSNLKERGHKVKHILVTREETPVGYKLRDLCSTLDINKEVVIMSRGTSRENLWKVYAAADVYMSCSKAEGLGIPILEAMATGLPIVATNTGALTELLAEGRGRLVDGEYEFIDVWGNSRRVMIDIGKLTDNLENCLFDWNPTSVEYAQSRTFDKQYEILEKHVKELIDG